MRCTADRIVLAAPFQASASLELPSVEGQVGGAQASHVEGLSERVVLIGLLPDAVVLGA